MKKRLDIPLSPVEGFVTEVLMGRRPKGTGCLYKQPHSDVWWGQFYVDGKRYRESTGNTDKEKAQEWLVGRISEVRVAGPLPPRALVIDDLIEAKLADERRKGLKDLSNPQSRWTNNMHGFFHNMPVRECTSARVLEFSDLRRKASPPATVNRELAVLKRAFSVGFELGMIRHSDIPAIKFLPEKNARQGFIENAEYTKIMEAAKPEGPWALAWLEMASTYGWRRGEMLSLRVGWVDFERCAVSIPDSKSGDPRCVPMSVRLREYMRPCCANKKPGDFVLTRDGVPVRDYRNAWKRILERAGIKRHIIPHDLRRSACRLLTTDLGVSESIAMSFTGHKTASTFRRYNIVSLADQRKAVERLDRYAHTRGKAHTKAHTKGQNDRQDDGSGQQVA